MKGRTMMLRVGSPQEDWAKDMMDPPTDEQFRNPRVRRTLMTPEEEVMSLPEKARLKRSQQVAQMVMDGKGRDEIASELGIKPQTVYWYCTEATREGLLAEVPFPRDDKEPNPTAVVEEPVVVVPKAPEEPIVPMNSLDRRLRDVLETQGIQALADTLAAMAKTTLGYHDVEQVILARIGAESPTLRALQQECIESVLQGGAAE